MKKILAQYAGYNLWANRRIIETLLSIDEEQWHREINSIFNSIYRTVVHLWEVESVWWQRMKLKEQVEWPGAAFTGTVAELGRHLTDQSKLWEEWIAQATEAALQHEFIYRNTKKEQFKQPVHEAVHHLFNHQTFHRGQLVTMMRQIGVTTIPSTDLIVYLRKK
jgi:uncharacterized damage-inducible protein DinB